MSSNDFDSEEFSQFMDITGLWGPVSAFPCDDTEGDWVQMRRIGSPQSNHAAVSVHMTNFEEPDFVSEDESDDGHFVMSVLLSPSNARRMAVALVEAADEADGNFTNLMGGGNLDSLN